MLEPRWNRTSHSAKLIWLFFIFIVVTQVILKNQFFPFFLYNEQPHYLGVSWNLWESHQWLLLEDTNGLYINKPPLLFWMVNSIWTLLGTHNYLILSLQGALTLLSMWFTQKSFETLWPEEREQSWIAPAILLGFAFIQIKYTFYNFEPLVVACASISLLGCCLALKNRFSGWLLIGLGMGLGLLSKGPVILFFSLVPALMIGFQRREIKGLLTSLFIALVLILSWLIPLYYAITPEKFAILIKLKAFGGTKTYGVAKPWYFYFAHLPEILLPWLVWPQLWFAGAKTLNTNSNRPMWHIIGCCLLIMITMSCVGIKRTRYILAILPWFSLIFAYWCSQWYRDKTLQIKYPSNYPLISIVFMAGAALIILPFVSTSIQGHTITFTRHALPGIFLIILSIVALAVSYQHKTTNILLQLFMMSSLISTTWIIDTINRQKNLEMDAIAAFLQTHDNHPIAYVSRYGGYLMRVGDRQFPDGYNVPEHQLPQFLQAHPDAWIVDKFCGNLDSAMIRSPSTCIHVRQGKP